MLLNFRLTTRIAAGVGILVMLIIAVGLAGALSLRSQGSTTRNLLQGNITGLRAALMLSASVPALATGTPEATTSTNEAMSLLAAAPISADLLLPRDALLGKLRGALANPAGAARDAALMGELGRFVTTIDAATTRNIAEQAADADRMIVAMGLIVAVAAAFAGWLGWAMRQSIRTPVEQLVQDVQRIAGGDLVTRIHSKGRDEFSWLNHEMNQMRKKLNATIEAVRGASATVAHATGEIASGNADLSARTEGQAGSIEETAASMEQLTATVRQNADNARQANQLVVRASDVATRGGAVMNEVVTTMGDINASARRAVDIISVIDGIAFQTNILALNAAVEAARAGEQGRGFAVVASEVRSLAQRSAEASKEIKQLIGNSVEKADLGAKLVGDAGATMEEILISVKQVTDIMSEISAASEEQRSGIEQVNSAIEQMDSATQQNAALVEQAAAAAESLKEQAGRLHAAVEAFKTA